MARTQSIGKFKLRLRDALAMRDWQRFHVARERLVELAVEAALAGDDDALADIERTFSAGHSAMVFQHGVDPEPSETSAAWMMRADADVAALARRMVPRRIRALAPEDLGVRERLLLTLARSNRAYVNNNDLARLCRAAPPTVCRVLQTLRSEGLVDTVAAGSRQMNRLTEHGRREAEALRRLEGGRSNEAVLRSHQEKAAKLLAPPVSRLDVLESQPVAGRLLETSESVAAFKVNTLQKGPAVAPAQEDLAALRQPRAPVEKAGAAATLAPITGGGH